MKYVILILLLIPITGFGLTSYQIKVRNWAYFMATPYNLGYTFTSIIGVESNFCKTKHGIDPLGNGCSQIHQRTAEIITGIPFISRKILITNDRVNLDIALEYLRFCFFTFHNNWVDGVLCYNKGPTGVQNIPPWERSKEDYVKKVRTEMLRLFKTKLEPNEI